jgi:phenylacetate-CoA ligase
MLGLLHEYLKTMKNPWKSVETVKKIQEKMMRNIISFAYHNTRFYKEKFKKAGITPSDIQSLADLKKIPVVTKDQVRENPESLFASGYTRENSIVEQTTGSTGKILPILHNNEAISHFYAISFRMYWRWGYRPFDKLAYIGHGKTQQTMLDKSGLSRRKFISIFLSEREQIEVIKKFNPDVLCGYPSTIKGIMNEITADDLAHINLKFILLNSELLPDKLRAQAAQIFGADVFEEYSSYEVYFMAHECPLHNYHIVMDNVILNFLDDNHEEVSPGEQGRIVVTSLVNKAMPFIRYDLEDMGVPSDKICECGWNFKLMELLEGRKDDFLVMPNEYLMSPRKVVPVVEMTPGIKEFQIVQETRDIITIYIVKDENYTQKAEQALKEQLHTLFKTSGCQEFITINIEYMDKIPRKRGKLRIVISKVGS